SLPGSGGRTPSAVTPTSSRSNFAWEDEKQSGTLFQVEDDAEQPLLPHSLPEDWNDESKVTVHRGPLGFVE
ncbi:unnamed protein product, partial [Durusdinium trenchii]